MPPAGGPRAPDKGAEHCSVVSLPSLSLCRLQKGRKIIVMSPAMPRRAKEPAKITWSRCLVEPPLDRLSHTIVLQAPVLCDEAVQLSAERNSSMVEGLPCTTKPWVLGRGKMKTSSHQKILVSPARATRSEERLLGIGVNFWSAGPQRR